MTRKNDDRDKLGPPEMWFRIRFVVERLDGPDEDRLNFSVAGDDAIDISLSCDDDDDDNCPGPVPVP